MPETTRPMSKSPIAVAVQAFEVAKRGLPSYSATNSPKFYTQHQLFALLVLRQFFKTDLRGIVAILQDSTDLRRVLGLRRVPHYSTLSYAEKRFFKGGLWPPAPDRGATSSGAWTAAAGK
jgi:hypothetical protein